MKRAIMLVGGLLFLLCAYAAPAQDEFVLPIEKKEYRGIPYISGGVGVDERKALAAMGKNYSLKLMFALKSREMLSGVKVQVSDGRGRPVFQAVSEGPLLYADLPPGNYQVAVAVAGNEKRRNVTIGGTKKQAELRFYWEN